jgi:hypothetical protein
VTPHELLRLLRDVPGVAGSCVFDANSRILVRDLPIEIADDLLGMVGRRADAALTAVRQPLPGGMGAALRFSRLAMFCGRAGTNVVVVLTAPGTSTTAMKAALAVSLPALSLVREPVVEQPPQPLEPVAPRGGRLDGIWG